VRSAGWVTSASAGVYSISISHGVADSEALPS